MQRNWYYILEDRDGRMPQTQVWQQCKGCLPPSLSHKASISGSYEAFYFAWIRSRPGMSPASSVILTCDLNLSEGQPYHLSNGDNSTQHISWGWNGWMNGPGYSSLKCPQGSLLHVVLGHLFGSLFPICLWRGPLCWRISGRGSNLTIFRRSSLTTSKLFEGKDLWPVFFFH